jgi:alcohol dehydrogenase class IV
VLGFGGGSALDAGKAIAALLTNGGELLDYLEVIGHGKPLTKPSAPFMAIPTTAGTGTEVTRNAVLAAPAQRVKVSLRSPLMLARTALIDPELTYALPPSITASTGLDALTQLIEPYVSPRANPLTDAVCVEGIRRVARSLPRAFAHRQSQSTEDARPVPDFAVAREDMALASLFGGLALANAGLGAVHSFAASIGGMFHAPHGAVCAALLPHVMKINLIALHERAPNNEAVRRYDHVAQILTGNQEARAADGILWIRDLCSEMQVSPLSAYEVTEKDFSTLVEKSAKASSMRANPVVLNPDELREILAQAL